MARYSQAVRPVTMDENPSTGWDGRGIRTPLTTPCGVTKFPEDGPGAKVSAGKTARPASVGVEAALASDAYAAAAGSVEITSAAASSPRGFMRVLPSGQLPSGPRPQIAARAARPS